MRKLLILPILVLGLVSSCGGSAETGKESSGLDGTWKIVKAEGQMADLNVGTQYIFDGNKLSLSGGGITTPGSFETSKDTIIFNMKDYPDPMKYLQSMKGKQLVLKVVGSDQVFYLDKQ